MSDILVLDVCGRFDMSGLIVAAVAGGVAVLVWFVMRLRVENAKQMIRIDLIFSEQRNSFGVVPYDPWPVNFEVESWMRTKLPLHRRRLLILAGVRSSEAFDDAVVALSDDELRVLVSLRGLEIPINLKTKTRAVFAG
jgi:hypothetical protein